MPDNGSRQPVVGVVMGSDSDWPVMEAAAKALDEFDVPHEVDVVSAHRMPREMLEYGARAARARPAGDHRGAGGAAHLPGMLAAVTPLPVIGVPVPLAHPGRAGLAAVDRPDAGRRAGRDGVDRRGAQRRPARRPDPRGGRGRPGGPAARALLEFAGGLRDEAAAKGERLRAKTPATPGAGLRLPPSADAASGGPR